MARFLVDEDFNQRIVRGLVRRNAQIDLLCVQDLPEIAGGSDPAVLHWAASQTRIVVTHDENTMTRHASARLESALEMPGLIVVPQSMSIGNAVDELLLIDGASHEGEWNGLIAFLPLK